MREREWTNERRERKIHTTHERTLIALSRAAIQLPMSNVLCYMRMEMSLCCVHTHSHSHSHCTLLGWCGYQSIQSKVELYHNDTHLKWFEVEKRRIWNSVSEQRHQWQAFHKAWIEQLKFHSRKQFPRNMMSQTKSANFETMQSMTKHKQIQPILPQTIDSLSFFVVDIVIVRMKIEKIKFSYE